MLPVNRKTKVANQSSVYTSLCKRMIAHQYEYLIHHFKSTIQKEIMSFNFHHFPLTFVKFQHIIIHSFLPMPKPHTIKTDNAN